MIFSTKLRLAWALLTKSLGFGEHLMNTLHKRYTGHQKIIFWKNGLPVYSGSTPPVFSKASANLQTTLLFQLIQNKKLPNLMSFAVNDVCNAGCSHCSFYEGIYSTEKQTLSGDEAKDLIRQAHNLGVSVFNFVGGEPLMSPDILEILRAVDKDRAVTTMFTNGWYLEEKAKDLYRAGLDTIYVSIDSADAETHDTARKLKGLFDRGVRGIEQAKKVGLLTGLSSTIYEEDLSNGNLEKLLELGKKLGVHEHIIFDAMPSGRLKKRSDLLKRGDWIETLEKKIEPYNKDNSYPGILIWGYAMSYKASGCACGVSTFYVSPYGDISSCDFNPQSIGNVRDEPLYKIWEKFGTMSAFKSAAWGGCKVKDPEFHEKNILNKSEITKESIPSNYCEESNKENSGGCCKD